MKSNGSLKAPEKPSIRRIQKYISFEIVLGPQGIHSVMRIYKITRQKKVQW